MNILVDFVNPATIAGAIFYGIVFLCLAVILSTLIHRTAQRIEQHLSDKTGVHFASVLMQALAYFSAFLLYSNLIPALRALATALLAGISVTSVIIGLAAQQTLGNLIAGVSLVLYRPVRIGDTIQVASPKGVISGQVESIALGFTILSVEDGNELIVPNTVMMTSTLIRVKKTSAPDGEPK